MTLRDASTAGRLPYQDLDRARRWYSEKLHRPGGGGIVFERYEGFGQPVQRVAAKISE